jgi:hypothetical protein
MKPSPVRFRTIESIEVRSPRTFQRRLARDMLARDYSIVVADLSVMPAQRCASRNLR